MSVTMRNSRQMVALLISTVLTFMWVPGVLLTPSAFAASQVVNGFEIEGNLVQDAPANDDWQTVLDGPSGADPVGNAEDSVFQTSSKEDEAPTTWSKGTSNIDPKDDIG